MKYLVILLIGILITDCSDNNNEDILLDKCNDGVLVKELTEDIPAIVRQVKEGEPFYNGSKIYYEVDVDKYLKDIFVSNPPKTIRLFPINKINRSIGSHIEVRGTITSCLTGDHGLLTLDLKGFYLLEQ